MAAFLISAVALLAIVAMAALGPSTLPRRSATATAPQGWLSGKTAAVLSTLASTNLLAMESGRLALARSQSPAVRELAESMVHGHTAAAQRMRQVLAEIGASPPQRSLETAHRRQLDALTTVTNAEFDRAYLEAQYTMHAEAIAVLRDYARTGDHERLMAWAGDALLLLQTCLDHVSCVQDGTHEGATAAAS